MVSAYELVSLLVQYPIFLRKLSNEFQDSLIRTLSHKCSRSMPWAWLLMEVLMFHFYQELDLLHDSLLYAFEDSQVRMFCRIQGMVQGRVNYSYQMQHHYTDPQHSHYASFLFRPDQILEAALDKVFVNELVFFLDLIPISSCMF